MQTQLTPNINSSSTSSMSQASSSQNIQLNQHKMTPEKSTCICFTLQKRSSTRLSDPIGFKPKYADSATVVSFKEKLPSLFSPYDSSHSYFKQAFYDITEIGHGSFGVVYAATSRVDDKRYAVKRSHNVYSSRFCRKRMLHEVKVHESLPLHKNLVNFVMAWEECDRLYIQLELCHYRNLADMRKCASCMTETAVLNWAKDMALALSQLHDLNLVHLDVKPDNMFIGFDGNCKLGDFGSALYLTTDKIDDWDDGDGRYLAPEILNNPPTKAADIFSLGISMLELGSGVDFASNKFDSRQQCRSVAFDKLTNTNLKQLIKNMTNEIPEKRPTASDILSFNFSTDSVEKLL